MAQPIAPKMKFGRYLGSSTAAKDSEHDENKSLKKGIHFVSEHMISNTCHLTLANMYSKQDIEPQTPNPPRRKETLNRFADYKGIKPSTLESLVVM
jgi:hypothetical protein